MQKLAGELLQEKNRPASIEDTIHWTFQFDDGPLWDSLHNIRLINAAQDAYTDRDRNLRASALPHSSSRRPMEPFLRMHLYALAL